MISKGFRAVERRHRDEDESDDACESKDDDDEFHGKKLPQVVRESRDRLKKIYQEGKVLVGYGLCEESGGDTPVDEIFVNITLVPRENLEQVFTEAPIGARSVWTPPRPSHALQSSAVVEQGGIELSELFVSHRKSPGQSSTTISGVMAIGSGGIGKSTVFTCRLPYLWSLGQCMEDVDLLLCVPLGDVSNVEISSAEELFASFLDLDSDEKKTMLHYVRENPSRACIVLDGVDECKDIMERASPFMMKLLKGKTTLRGLKTIVTSRPCRAVHQLAQRGCFDRKLEVVGFSSSDVGTFVNKALPAAKASAMMQKLAESDETRSLMTTPFMASLCCEEFGRSGLLSDYATDLFEKMLVRLLEVQAGEQFDGIEALPHKQKSILKELGDFAFKKFVAGHFSFSGSDLDSLSVEARHLGVLVASMARSGKPHRYRFSHLLLLDFLAAFFAATNFVHFEDDIEDVVIHVKCQEVDTMNFNVFFCALVREESLQEREENLQEQSPPDKPSSLSRFGRFWAGGQRLNPFDTSDIQKVHAVLSGCMDRQAMNSLAAILLKGIFPQESTETAVENRMPRSQELRDSNFLLSLLKLWKEKRPLADKSVLRNALQQINDGAILEADNVKQVLPLDADLEQQDFSEIVAKHEQVLPEAVVAALQQILIPPQQQYLFYTSIHVMTSLWLGLYERLKKSLTAKRNVSTLQHPPCVGILGNVECTSARMAFVLEHLTKSCINILLCFSEEGLMGDSATDHFLLLLKGLHACTGLQQVILRDINWPRKRLIALSIMLQKHADTLFRFIVGNSTTGYDCDPLRFLMPGLAKCSNLTIVYMTGVLLDEKSVGMLANALQSRKMPLIQEFSVASCNMDSLACVALLQALSSGSCPRLQVLSLKDNGLSTSCITPLCSLLRMCPELQTVDIRGSRLFSDRDGSSLDRQLLPLAQHIMRCNALKSFLLFDDEAHYLEVCLMHPLAAIAFCSLVESLSSCIECLW